MLRAVGWGIINRFMDEAVATNVFSSQFHASFDGKSRVRCSLNSTALPRRRQMRVKLNPALYQEIFQLRRKPSTNIDPRLMNNYYRGTSRTLWNYHKCLIVQLHFSRSSLNLIFEVLWMTFDIRVLLIPWLSLPLISQGWALRIGKYSPRCTLGSIWLYAHSFTFAWPSPKESRPWRMRTL